MKHAQPAFKVFTIVAISLLLFFTFMDDFAYARAGGGRSSGGGFRSSGSYGGSTSTPYRSSPTQQQQQQGTAGQSTAQQPSSPGRSLLYGIGGGLMGGMIGSMLLGGRGYGSQGWGEGGFGIGDFLIILIILGIIYSIIKRYKAKKAMQMSSVDGGGYGSYAYNEPADDYSSHGSPAQEDTVVEGLKHIGQMDVTFGENTFKEAAEDMFFKIQGAWTKRDLSGVLNLLTAQMLDTFQTDINTFITNKQFNRLENIAVRQVEIVDAVQDRGEEYIKIKFLASLLDYTVDETTGNAISGSPIDPVKFLEYWTFTRKVGEKGWALAGITQEQDYH